ncbi:MAG: type II toxin-antitoxin system PemK/MazF family toxin [Bacteroidetes bacterium]|nr:MAG: type II toxin-antitoxin system PemK/MazF family toxin [Bacteroidota bacterium]
MRINQYDVVLVNLDPAVGSEIKKTRPCVIISPNEMNHNLNTMVVAPMTTKSKNYPTRIRVKQNNKIGFIVVDQIRTIDKKRIINRFEKLTSSEISKLKAVIKETFVD